MKRRLNNKTLLMFLMAFIIMASTVFANPILKTIQIEVSQLKFF